MAKRRRRRVAVTPFAGETNFADLTLTATNHTTKRTLSAHLGDVYNVVGFGASGTSGAGGSSANVTAIQAATDACHAAGGGTVYFPMGQYNVNASIVFDWDDEVGIRFVGEGVGEGDPTRILGGFDGFIFDRSLATPNNTNAQRSFERLTITNSHATGGGVRIGSSIGAAIRSCNIVAHIAVTTEDEEGVSSTNLLVEDCRLRSDGDYAGANCLVIGGGGAILGTDIRQGNAGVRAYGSGLFMAGNRIERCNIGILLGVDSGDNDVGLNGFCLMGQSMEGHWTAIDFAGTVSGFQLSGLYIMGHDGNSGPSPSVFPEAGLDETQRAIYIRANKANNGVIQASHFGNWHDIAGFEMEDSTARANILVTGLSHSVVGPGTPWVFPTKAHTALFINNSNQPTYLYSGLPSSPLEGEEVTITNANTATWGDPVTTTGANHVMVRYNGSAWTVVGK